MALCLMVSLIGAFAAMSTITYNQQKKDESMKTMEKKSSEVGIDIADFIREKKLFMMNSAIWKWP